ncbi:uncharacterized protein LOC111781615 [Cucurbita pepo subsp. pepo]|uniref:uncharacterized protein LOC111781615 n=1 Tax=Cucurbita pepo subsp. pepo TaxID=3664 RepID=UPI000C9DA413|nr:uncharacterized protein LOC111781615 [Cucurbita pepo subsp. pepo]
MEADNRYNSVIFRESFQAYEEVGGQEASPPPIPSRRSNPHQVETRNDQISQPKGPETSSKYEGPVEVLKKIGATSYRVALPTLMKIQPVIHVSNLMPYHPDPDDDQRNVITRLSIDLKQRDSNEIEKILADRVRKIGRPVQTIREFLVKWKNLPKEETSWERTEDLDSATTHIARFESSQLTGTSTN